MSIHKSRSRVEIAARRGPLVALAVAAAAIPGTGEAAAASTKAKASPPAPDLLAGTTSQGWPAYFRLSPNGRMLLDSGIGLDMKCTSGNSYALPDGWIKVPISATGKLIAATAFPLKTFSDGNSVAGTAATKLTFSKNRRKLTGTWQLHETWIMANGTRDECDSGVVRFTATA